MSFNKKSSFNYNAGNKKFHPPPKVFGKKPPSQINPDSGISSGRGFTSTANTSQNKTPNKSGLTPVRPTKSPGTGMKLKSGLTPIKPGVQQGQSKSPFVQKPKLKSGLLPIKPGLHAQAPAEIDCSSFAARRKSGLKPMKPVFGGCFSNGNFQNKAEMSVLESKPFSFAIPKPGGFSYDTIPQSASRRKSGLLPMKQNLGTFSTTSTDRQPSVPSWRPRNSLANSNINSEVQRLSQMNLRSDIEATPSLNAIKEDGESPVNFRNNMSGLALLDDTADMSVVIRPRSGQGGSARIPLPRSTLDPSHFGASGSKNSRIPKRVLNFEDEDCTVRTYANVLKDGSSKLNTIEETDCSSKVASHPAKASSTEKKANPLRNEEALLHRKKEIEEIIERMKRELDSIEEQLRDLQEVKCLTANTVASECVGEKRDDDIDSPFANVLSPFAANPLELLTLDKSKRPENIYKVFRQSCSFLKTPQPSAFRKPKEALRHTHSYPEVEDSSNVSYRVQKQLADLFDE